MLGSAPQSISEFYYLIGMSTDYSITNTAASTIELDVYEWVARKDFEYTSATTAMSDFVNNQAFQEAIMPGAAGRIQSSDLGFVPTDANGAMRKILILSKQRFYIASGNTVSFVKRHKYRRPIKFGSTDFAMAYSASAATSFEAKRGVTRGLILCYRGTPNATNGSSAASIAWNAQTRYTMKQIDYNENKSAINY
jgi:hypothetical protein